MSSFFPKPCSKTAGIRACHNDSHPGDRMVFLAFLAKGLAELVRVIAFRKHGSGARLGQIARWTSLILSLLNPESRGCNRRLLG